MAGLREEAKVLQEQLGGVQGVIKEVDTAAVAKTLETTPTARRATTVDRTAQRNAQREAEREAQRLRRALNSEADAINRLRNELDPVREAMQDYTEKQELLARARERDIVNLEEYRRLNEELDSAYQQQIQDITGVTEALDTMAEKRAEEQRRADEIALAAQEAAMKAKDQGFDAMEEFATSAARSIQQTFSDELFNVMEGDFEGMADRFNQMLLKMAADLVSSQLLSQVQGLFNFGTQNPALSAPQGSVGFGLGGPQPGGGGFDLSKIFSGFSGLFGGANGLDFRVGGVGGIDSQTVAFRSTPGSRVVEIPPGGRDANAGHGMGRTIKVDMHLHGVQDDRTFRRNRSQIVNGLHREIQEAERMM